MGGERFRSSQALELAGDALVCNGVSWRRRSGTERFGHERVLKIHSVRNPVVRAGRRGPRASRTQETETVRDRTVQQSSLERSRGSGQGYMQCRIVNACSRGVQEAPMVC